MIGLALGVLPLVVLYLDGADCGLGAPEGGQGGSGRRERGREE